jgi:hypothetical protein
MNRYKIILTAEQSNKFVNLILNNYSIVESIEYLIFSDEEIFNDHFNVTGFWYSSIFSKNSANPSCDLAEYGTKYFYKNENNKVFNKIHDFMKPLIRDTKIEELGL